MQFCIGQISALQVGLRQAGQMQMRSAQIFAAQAGATEISFVQEGILNTTPTLG